MCAHDTIMKRLHVAAHTNLATSRAVCTAAGTSAPLLAIADLHGDLKQAFKALLLAGAVDEQGAWAGGNATLVQTGDMFDRGPESLAVLGLLERLKARLQPVPKHKHNSATDCTGPLNAAPCSGCSMLRNFQHEGTSLHRCRWAIPAAPTSPGLPEVSSIVQDHNQEHEHATSHVY